MQTKILEFLHAIGDILYFPLNSGAVVFTDPTWFLRCISMVMNPLIIRRAVLLPSQMYVQREFLKISSKNIVTVSYESS
jgi:hypothetical protein